ncbi:MAG: hypothetical protein IJD91_01085 [Clostridia bacterium]|nr:hypothetical protein [Clostridia bacterium]
MKKLDVMERTERIRKSGIIKSAYDLKVKDIMRIRECSEDDYEKLTNSFAYGYAQGYKAAMAEMKKKAKEVKAV